MRIAVEPSPADKQNTIAQVFFFFSGPNIYVVLVEIRSYNKYRLILIWLG
jgi:hypothetical protein